MLGQTAAITNEVLEPITFVLAYPTVLWFYPVHSSIFIYLSPTLFHLSSWQRR